MVSARQAGQYERSVEVVWQMRQGWTAFGG